jgi:hypothetical protein
MVARLMSGTMAVRVVRSHHGRITVSPDFADRLLDLGGAQLHAEAVDPVFGASGITYVPPWRGFV